MQIYQLKRMNLPADVLVLKEIARRVLPAKQYSYLIRKHNLAVSPRKLIGNGLYSNWRYEITIGVSSRDIEPRPEHPLLLSESIGVFLHELAHMCQRNNRNINHNKGHHRRTFWNTCTRLKQTYETEVKQKLPEIVSLYQDKQNNRLNRLTERREAIARARDGTKLPSHKLAQTQDAICRWEGKLRRCETRLKKLRRREKIYKRLAGKNQSLPVQGMTSQAEIGKTD